MTSKALLGLVGGGSVAAGLGTGFGVGFNTQPFYINEDMMNTFYSNLIESAEIEIAEYDNLGDGDKNTFLEKYKKEVCDIANDNNTSYKAEGAKQRVKEDKALCGKGELGDNNNKSEWEAHFKNSAEDLRKEWAEFKKHIYDPKPRENRE